MFLSDFALSLLVEVDKIFGSDEFPESNLDFIIVSDFSSIRCLFLRVKSIEDKTAFHFVDCIFSSAVSTFLATLSFNFFWKISSASNLFLSLSFTFFAVVFATASAFFLFLSYA